MNFVEKFSLLAFILIAALGTSAQQNAVITDQQGSKVYLKLDTKLLQGDLDTLYAETSSLQTQITNRNWADVLAAGATPGMHVDFFGFEALGLGAVTTEGTFTGDSLVLQKDATVAGRLDVSNVTSLGDSLLVEGTVVFADSLRVVKATSIGSRLYVTGVTELGDSLRVVGNVSLGGLLHAAGAATLGSSLSVAGKTTLNDTLRVNATALLLDSLDVAGNVRLAQVLYADSIVSAKVIHAQIRDLANHTTDGLAETSTNRYFTPAREQVLQEQITSLQNQFANLLDQLFDPATVTTTAATSVLAFTASINATFDAGGAAVEDAGFILSVNSDLSDSTVYAVTGSGSLVKALSSLTKGTTYYYRAFVETIMGREEGSTMSFTTIDDAQLSTVAVNNAAQTTATLRGQVTSNGGGTVTATGFRYSTNANLSGATNVAGSALSGAFTAALSGLVRNTTYYYTAYATNQAGTTTGDTLSFSTVGPCGGTFALDYWGYSYDLVEIGDDCWFAENLRTTKYRDGSSVNLDGRCAPNADGTSWTDANYLATYGYLYLTAPSGSIITDNLCPSGWKLPTVTDFNNLKSSAGNASNRLRSVTGWGGAVANNTGFNALPGGATDSPAGASGFPGTGSLAVFWHAPSGLTRALVLTEASITIGWWAATDGNLGGDGASIRCIKD